MSTDRPGSIGLRAPGGRSIALDMLKGALVLVMVLYHTMNLFTTAGAESYSYIRFVSGSFIILSGYIIGQFEEREFAKCPAAVSRRLVWRGGKLWLLFTMLNMAIAVTGIGNPDKARVSFTFGSLLDIYVSGGLRKASFQILLPIAYLLVLSPVLLFFRAPAPGLLFVSIAVAALSPLVIEAEQVNAEFLLLGIMGFYGGLALGAWRISFSLSNGALIGAALSAAILLMKWLVFNPAAYALGTALIMKLIYDAALVARMGGVSENLALLGRYSLFAYVSQIIILQFVWRALGRPKWDLGYEAALVAVLAGTLLYALVYAVSTLRRRFSPVDYAYSAIFR